MVTKSVNSSTLLEYIDAKEKGAQASDKNEVEPSEGNHGPSYSMAK